MEVKEMKSLFGFQVVKLIDTLILRAQEGSSADSTGYLPVVYTADETKSGKSYYDLRVGRTVVNGAKGDRLMRIGELHFGGRFPVSNNSGDIKFTTTGINTGLDLREGQRVVVGKVDLDPSSNPFFLVVSAKVVE